MTSATEITMPRLSDSMEEGTIARWLVADGQPVANGQELVEIETDKATITHPAEAEGTLEIVAAEGTTLAVGETIARIGAGAPTGAGVPAEPASTADAPDRPERAAAAPGEPESVAAEPRETRLAPASAGAPAGNSVALDAERSETDTARLLATPLARRAARTHGIELGALVGSGPRGRITRADVLKAAGIADSGPGPASAAGRAPGAASSASAGSGTLAQRAVAVDAAPRVMETGARGDGAKGQTRLVQASRLQQLIARRMAEAKATIPHFQVQTEVRMDAALTLRAELKANASAGETPSINDLVVKACALALRAHPQANGSYVDGGFELHERINIGVAVASEDALVVPVLTDADVKSLGAIARETRRLAERVRSGAIAPPELSGGTFTVSNLGMFGMTAISPVINPPQAAILGVGSLRETLARAGGEIVDRTLMTLTLSCDHRILYGADAAWLLSDVRELLEKPLGLVL